MTKKLFLLLAIIAGLVLTPKTSLARTICTQEYGKPVKCYEEEDKVLGVTHEPVEAGILDSPLALVVGLLFVSVGFTYLSRRVKPSRLQIK